MLLVCQSLLWSRENLIYSLLSRNSRCMYQCTNIVSSVVMFIVKEGWVRMTYKEIIQQSQSSHSCSKCHHNVVSVRQAGLCFYLNSRPFILLMCGLLSTVFQCLVRLELKGFKEVFIWPLCSFPVMAQVSLEPGFSFF